MMTSLCVISLCMYIVALLHEIIITHMHVSGACYMRTIIGEYMYFSFTNTWFKLLLQRKESSLTCINNMDH